VIPEAHLAVLISCAAELPVQSSFDSQVFPPPQSPTEWCRLVSRAPMRSRNPTPTHLIHAGCTHCSTWQGTPLYCIPTHNSCWNRSL